MARRAVFCANVVADQLNRGIFETYLADACVPFIPEPLTSSRVAAVSNALTVRDVMAAGVTALPPVVAASRLVDVLRRHPYAVRICRTGTARHVRVACTVPGDRGWAAGCGGRGGKTRGGHIARELLVTNHPP